MILEKNAGKVARGKVKQIIESSNQILSPNQMFQVRYEEFVEKAETGIRRICEFLGIEFEDAMLDPATFIDYSLYSSLNEERDIFFHLRRSMEWSKSKSVRRQRLLKGAATLFGEITRN